MAKIQSNDRFGFNDNYLCFVELFDADSCIVIEVDDNKTTVLCRHCKSGVVADIDTAMTCTIESSRDLRLSQNKALLWIECAMTIVNEYIDLSTEVEAEMFFDEVVGWPMKFKNEVQSLKPKSVVRTI